MGAIKQKSKQCSRKRSKQRCTAYFEHIHQATLNAQGQSHLPEKMDSSTCGHQPQRSPHPWTGELSSCGAFRLLHSALRSTLFPSAFCLSVGMWQNQYATQCTLPWFNDYQVCVHVCVCCGSSLHNKMEILEIALWVILVWILRYKLALLCYFSMYLSNKCTFFDANYHMHVQYMGEGILKEIRHRPCPVKLVSLYKGEMWRRKAPTRGRPITRMILSHKHVMDSPRTFQSIDE